MSELPKGWVKVPLSEIALTTSGGTPNRSRSEYYGGSIPWVKSGELKDGWIEEAEETVTDIGLENSSAKVFPAGTLCIALYGATVGKVGILKIDAATNQAVCGITPGAEIETKYLFYFLLSQRPRFIGLSQGGAQPNISQGIIRSTNIPVCPTSEQSRIVSEIEKQFTRLDAAAAALKRVQANLKRYRASVLKAACEGRLVPTEAELARNEGRDYEPADKLLERILRERRARWEADTLAKMIASAKPPKDDSWKQKYKEPSAPDTTNLPTLPEGWCWTRIGYAFDCVVPNRDKPESFTGIIPWLTLPDFGNGIEIEESKHGMGLSPREVTQYRAKVIPANSVVMSCVGTFGITAVLKQAAVINQQLHAFLIPVWLPGKYFAYALRSQKTFMEAQSTATTIAYLNKDKCNSVPVPLAPLEEQNRISQALDRQMSLISRLENELELRLIQTWRLRQSTLHIAFSGQLVPHDPADEPASVLLERIRASREKVMIPEVRRRRNRTPHPVVVD